jgi:hypothetical protein
MGIVRRMGEVYSAGDVVVTIAGLFDVNPSAIEYNYKYAHEYQRGIKRAPRGWRMGAKELDGKVTLPMDVIAQIELAAPSGDIAMIRPFPINVTFANTENVLISDTIFAKFTGNGRNVTADGALEKELELFVLDIKLHVNI